MVQNDIFNVKISINELEVCLDKFKLVALSNGHKKPLTKIILHFLLKNLRRLIKHEINITILEIKLSRNYFISSVRITNDIFKI